MSIPLDRLYHYIDSLCTDDIIIYRWAPHGSKNLADLLPYKSYIQIDYLTRPALIAHDQEPLDYDHFEYQSYPKHKANSWFENQEYVDFISPIPTLRFRIDIWNIYDKMLLCHSEKNSAELKKFDPYFIGVYYWSHALIARDWFRFAQHDGCLNNVNLDYKHTFLIYNRSWSGTREYRLKFIESLTKNKLIECSLVRFSPTDSGIHYTQHKFKNCNFEIDDFSLETQIPDNLYTADASADYTTNDYQSCGIEVVLETLFDDNRNHLTEKTLRPIACGKPFILAATPGSLQYLRDYGFKTFDGLIDESYDEVPDSKKRLDYIVAEMCRINSMSYTEKSELFAKLNEIAEYNKKLFFSNDWQQSIVNEFVSNYNSAYTELQQYKTGKFWRTTMDIVKTDPTLQDNIKEHCIRWGLDLDQFNLLGDYVRKDSSQ